MKTVFYSMIVITALMISGCHNNGAADKGEEKRPDSFDNDLSFLKDYDSGLVVLKTMDGAAQIIVSPKYQGKVFTSTADGPDGKSFGWVNYKAFDKTPDSHMNAYGGEDRLWLGPEGGPFSLYFAPGDTMVYDNWHTPPAFDTEAWNTLSGSDTNVVLSKDMELENYKGTRLKINVKRRISMLTAAEIEKMLPINIGSSVKTVGFSTINTLTNTGDFEWNRETGAPCLWNLDMFTPSPGTVIVIPYNANTEGKVATTDYFGEIPPDRIKIDKDVIYFKADGKSRGKMGLPANRSARISGSYAADEGVLTVTYYGVDSSATYLNQEWTTKKDPFSGDAANAYNDGPLEDGSQMGPFYEIESVSPAAFIKSGEAITHRHSVFHFIGDKKELNDISEKLFKTSLKEIEQKF